MRDAVPVNRLKAALSAGQSQIGLWCTLAGPSVVELLGEAGFDWLLLDMEHSPSGLTDILAQLRACHGAPITAVVRPPANDPIQLKQLLDVGAQSVLIPMVDDAAQAAQAVRAVRYPPAGRRGYAAATRANRYGRLTRYGVEADDQICLMVQVETRSALDNLEAICGVDGVDAVFVGAADLAADMGLIGGAGTIQVQDAVVEAVRTIRRCGRPAGVLSAIPEHVQRAADAGATFLGVGSDAGLLMRNARELASRFRAPPAER